MTTHTKQAPRVVLHAPQTALAWLVLAKGIYECLVNNKTLYPTPNPPLATLNADIAALDTAEQATHNRAPGAVDTRNAKLVIVRSDLKQVVAYVQGLVDADPKNAANIASTAGLALRKTSTRTKSEVAAKAGKVSGAVDVAAKLGRVKAAHEWEYSSDGGKTWTAVPTTLQAKTTLTGLTPGASILVRHRAVTKAGAGDWAQTQPLTVV